MVNIPKYSKFLRTLVLKPVAAFPATFAITSILLFIPQLYGCTPGQILPFLWKGLWNNMFLCCTLSYILILVCYGLSRMHRVAGTVSACAILLVCCGLAATDHFLFHTFGTHINAYILQLVNETTDNETEEFFRTYILNRKFLKTAAFTLCSFLASWLLARLAECSIFRKSAIKVTVLLYICVSGIYSLCSIYRYFSLNVVENTVQSLGHSISQSFIFNTYNAVLQFVQEKDEFEKCSNAQDGIQAECDGSGPADIVVIIGESHSRYHSSLYGYNHLTNPLLGSLRNLSVFSDVISSVNATSLSFKNFLSLASLDGETEWYEEPLFPAVFKNAGYNVCFFSNQFVYDPGMDTYDASCGFFNHPSVQNKLFNHKNKIKFDFDSELVDAYKAERREMETDRNLVIFNLSGQHVRASERYPEGWDRFHPEDYPERSDLSPEQKQYVSEYDNATLYNDFVIHEVIQSFSDRDAVLIYFSDHGDEVHDFRNHVGRSHDYDEGGAKSIHCQLDIPFLIYCSEECAEKHPELCRRIADSVDLPFMTDDLPHLLMDIAGITCEGFEPERSLVNPAFNKLRKRVPRAITSSVRVNYDSIPRIDIIAPGN